VALLRILLMLIVGLALYLKIFENKLIFYPTKTLNCYPQIPFEQVHFRAADGTHLSGWFIPFQQSPHVFVISTETREI